MSVSKHTGRRGLCIALLALALSLRGLAADEPAKPGSETFNPGNFSHQAWSGLLGNCVTDTPNGGGTAVDYRCMADAHEELTDYLDALSAVEESRFDTWPGDTQLAFLINAYNAWTVQLILEHYPGLASIRDIGGLFSSPWKRQFIPLLGETRSLDDIEHGMIRAPGRFDEPRIHFAVNCASIGCPALRREAYRGAELEAQLEAQTEQFLSDRSRNGLREDRLEVTSLFKWYRGDFERPWRDGSSLREFLAGYASALGLGEAQRRALLDGELRIRFRDYDWQLNDIPR